MRLADLAALAEVGGHAAEVGDLRRIVEIKFARASTSFERQAEKQLVVVLAGQRSTFAWTRLSYVVALERVAIERGRGQVDAARVLPAVSRAAQEQHARSR